MRKTKRKRPAKKVVRSKAIPVHKSVAPAQETAITARLPFVDSPATQVIIALEEPRPRPVSPLLVWSAFPFALMRMALGTRHAMGR